MLGDPVSHSLSPAIQNAAILVAGLDAVYVALRCSRADAPGLLVAIARANGGGNVTVPHKVGVVRILEVSTAAVQRTGACNTFWLQHGRVMGDNTDVAGFAAAVRARFGDPAGSRVLLLGAGGAARAAACALLDAGAARIDLVNRTPDRAAELAHRLEPEGRIIHTAPTFDVVAGERFDLVINATSLGLRDVDPEPCDLRRLLTPAAAIDLVYRRGGTRWTSTAAEFGIPAMDGTEMLLHQGAASFERWFAQPAPIAAMRAAISA